jgi:hypothetical protein
VSEHEQLARTRKATKIAERLIDFGLDAEEAEWLPDEAWRSFAYLAGCREPSEMTKLVVAEIMRGREESARRLAAISDPLEGLG